MRRSFVVLVLLLIPAHAFGQKPKFEYGKGDEVKEIDKETWSATGQAGFILTTGNSKVVTFSGGAAFHRLAHRNKLSVEATGAYAKTKARIAADLDMDGAVSAAEVAEASTVSTEMWQLKARYDRFFTENNAVYGLGKIGAEVHAGKELVAGGQLGYSRTLLRSECVVIVAELGYDYSYEKYDGVAESVDSVSIHSARGFVGYDHTLTLDTSLLASVEALVNLNTLDAPGGEVEPGEDVRIESRAGLKTTLWKNVSFAFTFTARYDHAPAPLPPFDLPYAAGYTPLADTLDTITEAQLVVSFL